MKESLVGSPVVIVILRNTAQCGCLYLFSLFASILIRFPYPFKDATTEKGWEKGREKAFTAARRSESH
jgi:hypothetical protein